MKILMTNKFLYPAGGAEIYMLKLGQYLQEQGHQVEYFGMYHADNLVGNQKGIYTAPVDFHRKGIMTNMVNPWNVIYSGDAKKKIRILLDEFQPDIFHINNFNYQLTPSILVAAQEYRRRQKKALRIIYTAHDSQLICPNHYLYDPLRHRTCEKCLGGKYMNCVRTRCIHGSLLRSCLGTAEAFYWKSRKIYRTMDAVICPSLFMKGMLDTDPDLASKTVYLQNFVRSIEKKKKKKGGYILYFGRYSEEKGIRMLLDVCRELKDIPFAFAGSGPLAELVGRERNLKNLGFLGEDELDQAIRGARFTVCPSECNENCPLSVMESIANGRPVLGARRGGIPELIEEGKTGWLFPAGNKTVLAETIRKIWNSDAPERYASFCEAKEFDTIEKYGEKIIEIYKPCHEDVGK